MLVRTVLVTWIYASDSPPTVCVAFAALRVYALLAHHPRSTVLTVTTIVILLNVYPFLATLVSTTGILSISLSLTTRKTVQDSVQQANALTDPRDAFFHCALLVQNSSAAVAISCVRHFVYVV